MDKYKKKRDLAIEIINRFKTEYKDADCTLDYDEAWKLLVSVRLAAQCTDARPCGLGHSKARDISQCMKMLHGEFNDIVPDDFDKLMKLPGVGRKSANLIMGDVFHKPAIVTDTHCIRLTNRMGLIDNLKDPKKVEMELWKIIPPEDGNHFCHCLVEHGRRVCTARKPMCESCILRDICSKNI